MVIVNSRNKYFIRIKKKSNIYEAFLVWHLQKLRKCLISNFDKSWSALVVVIRSEYSWAFLRKYKVFNLNPEKNCTVLQYNLISLPLDVGRCGGPRIPLPSVRTAKSVRRCWIFASLYSNWRTYRHMYRRSCGQSVTGTNCTTAVVKWCTAWIFDPSVHLRVEIWGCTVAPYNFLRG